MDDPHLRRCICARGGVASQGSHHETDEFHAFLEWLRLQDLAYLRYLAPHGIPAFRVDLLESLSVEGGGLVAVEGNFSPLETTLGSVDRLGPRRRRLISWFLPELSISSGIMLSARVLALNRGKTGEVQRFSAARRPDPGSANLILEALEETTNPQRRNQILNDPQNCFQYACRWGDSVGMLTRPMIVTTGGDNPTTVVLGSFSDTIGQSFPVSVRLADFQGFFTTLVRKADAEQLRLSTHPVDPGTVPGPPEGITRHAPLVEASMDRLGYQLPDEPNQGDFPVIAALPCFLPIGPGQTFPHPTEITTEESFRESFLLFHVWRDGIAYCLRANGGQSVTAGGMLFHLPALVQPIALGEPFTGYLIRGRILERPEALPPTSNLFSQVAAMTQEWSETIWVELGNEMNPDPATTAPAPAVGLGAEQLKAVFEPLVSKEKEFRLAPRARAQYRLLLASDSAGGKGGVGVATLPTLKEEFDAYLTLGTGAPAAEDLREMVRS